MKITALDTHCVDFDGLSWQPIEELGTFEKFDRTPRELVAERLRESQAAITNKVVFDRELLMRLPALRYIGVTATGTNNIDLSAAAERGIAVTNVPAYSTDAVAQLVFAFLLQIACRISDYDHLVHDGDWVRSADFSLPRFSTFELAGKSLAIVGYGAIGARVAAIGRSFGMEILKTALSGRSYGEDRVPLDAALRRADVVSLHCPLTEATKQLINQERLALMKPGAILINLARGGLLDEAAVARALREERLAYACVDVLSNEPPPADNPLLSAPNVLVTPHVAWTTREARLRLITETVENLRAFARGEARNRVDNIAGAL